MDAALLINSCSADGRNPPDRTSLCVVIFVISFFCLRTGSYIPALLSKNQATTASAEIREVAIYHRQRCHWQRPAPRIPAPTTCNGCAFEFPETMRHAVPASVYPSAINCALDKVSSRHNDPLKIALPILRDTGSPPACTLPPLTVR
jgi:hypothetical protein